MAGQGFKDFTVGEVLTSADVDGYLMQQSVMRFADSAARGSALGTATGAGTALAEGMLSYLDDTDAVQYFDGTSWANVATEPPAGIGSNVVQAVKDDAFTSTSTTFTLITDLEVTITPTSATSKILLVPNIVFATSGGSLTARLLRDSTDIAVSTVGTTNGFSFGATSSVDQFFALTLSTCFVDSPATTSAITYSIHGRVNAGTFYINRRQGDLANGAISTLTAIEVAA